MGQPGKDNKTALALVVSAALLLSAWGGIALSQTVPAFSLNVAPVLPLAGDTITVSVTPENFAATSTVFTWYRDDAKLAASSGLGRSSLAVPTDPATAEAFRVRVEVKPGTGFSPTEQSTLVSTLPNPARQEEAIADITSGFSLEASALSPNAGETVSVEVVTFAFDKNAANYQWYVNGALDRAQSGRGAWRMSVAAPPEGGKRTIRVDITTPSGQGRSQSLTIQTASAPLYWWTDTSVPYWYKGKALPSVGSQITMMALPSTRSTSQLSFQWQINGSIVSQSSGVGRQTFSFRLGVPIEERIEVRMRDFAETFDKSVEGGIAPVEPQVGIYEVRPLRGVVYETSLREFSAPSGEPHDFVAVPFFFPRTADLSYRWGLNGEKFIGAPPDPWKFILTSKAGAQSSDALSVTVEDSARQAVRATTDLAVQLR